jgi:hypothetical protein
MTVLHVSFIGAIQGVVEIWTCQRQDCYGFSSTACDQTMEQMFIYGFSKTKGGIVGFTLNRTAAKRWILAQLGRGSIMKQCYVVAGLHKEEMFKFAYKLLYFCCRLQSPIYAKSYWLLKRNSICRGLLQ